MKYNLPINDAVAAHERACKLISLHKTADQKEKEKIKTALRIAASKAQTLGQTYVAALYRKTLEIIEES